MKNKKNTQKKITERSQSHVQNQLKRKQERLKKEAEKKEKKRNAIFRRRIREASEKKAPKTLRTKAYYRFSKDYPNDVTPDGFRKNDPQKETLSTRSKFTIFAMCLTAFIIGFIGVFTGVEFSKRPVPDDGSVPEAQLSEDTRALHITPDEFVGFTAEQLLENLTVNGYNSALIEVKGESGYVYFDSEAAVGGALSPAYDAYGKIKYLQDNGISCIAYISCFRDTAAATSSSGMEVRSSSTDSTFFDSDGYAWLDPFSEDAKKYNLDIIKEADEGGFSRIIIDNVCFPTKYTTEEPVYKADASSADSKNAVLINFINEAVSVAGKEKLTVMCDTYGFYENKETPNERYGRNLLKSECLSYAADLRLTRQETAVTGNTELFSYVEEMPMVFILDAGNIAVSHLTSSKEASNILAVVERDPADTYTYAVHSGIKNTIIW